MSAPEGMTEATAAEFYAFVRPQDCHPSVHYSPHYCVWELRDRRVIGRSYPGWKDPGAPRSYWIVKAVRS